MGKVGDFDSHFSGYEVGKELISPENANLSCLVTPCGHKLIPYKFNFYKGLMVAESGLEPPTSGL